MFWKKYKKIIIIGLAALITFIVLSIFLYALRHPFSQVDVPEEAESSSSSSSSSASAEVTEDNDTLTDEQKLLIENYDTDTKTLIETLTAYIWLSSSETSTLAFTENKITESSGASNEQIEHFYAVSALEINTSTESGVNGESATYTDYTIALLTDEGTYILNIRKTSTSNAENEAVWNITSDIFQYAKTYTPTKAATELTVSEPNEDYKELIGADYEKLSNELTEHCAVYYPTATSATWQESVTIDYTQRSVSTTFLLDNESKSEVEVIYDLGTGSFTFM